jgi:hypothetical protein
MEQQERTGATPGTGAGGVRGLASDTTEKLMDTAERQKRAGADYVSGVADSIRRAAGEFDAQLPQAAQYIRRAADQMEVMSDSLRRKEMRQMLSDVESFARRQPAAFLGVSLLAGFAAMRFFKSSSPASGRGTWHGTAEEDEPMYERGRYGSPASAATGRSAAGGEAGSFSSGQGM